jgi:hypothetical protein
MSFLQLVPDLEVYEVTAAQLSTVHVGRTISFWDSRQQFRVIGELTRPASFNRPVAGSPDSWRSLVHVPVGRGRPLLIPAMTPVVVIPEGRRVTITCRPKNGDARE